MNKLKSTIILSCILLTAILFGCGSKKIEDNIGLKGNAQWSEDVKVVLYFETQMNSHSYFSSLYSKMMLSQVLLYGMEGDLLSYFSLPLETTPEVVNTLADTLSFFYTGYNLLITDSGMDVLASSSGMLSEKVRSGPDFSGDIKDKEMTYALFNVGYRDSGKYLTVLRVADEELAYDIEIPYKVSYIAYDSVFDRFIFRVRPQNDDDKMNFCYGIIEFDEKDNKYCLVNGTQTIVTKEFNSIYGNGSYEKFCVEGNVIYRVDSYKYNPDIPLPEELTSNDIIDSDKKMYVLAADELYLDTGENIYYTLSKPYEGTDSGHRFMVGGADLPSVVRGDSIYVFVPGKVCIYTPGQGYKEYELKFDFDGANSATSIFGKAAKEDFSTSVVRVTDAGNVLVGHFFDDGKVRIHQLNTFTGEFELYWESKEKLSRLGRDDMEFLTFEIIP